MRVVEVAGFNFLVLTINYCCGTIVTLKIKGFEMITKDFVDKYKLIGEGCVISPTIGFVVQVGDKTEETNKINVVCLKEKDKDVFGVFNFYGAEIKPNQDLVLAFKPQRRVVYTHRISEDPELYEWNMNLSENKQAQILSDEKFLSVMFDKVDDKVYSKATGLEVKNELLYKMAYEYFRLTNVVDLEQVLSQFESCLFDDADDLSDICNAFKHLLLDYKNELIEKNATYLEVNNAIRDYTVRLEDYIQLTNSENARNRAIADEEITKAIIDYKFNTQSEVAKPVIGFYDSEKEQ